MQALGIDVLFKGINMQRLLGGLWISLRISLICFWMEHRGGDRLYHRIHFLGNRGDGGPCARSPDQYSETPI